MSTRVLYAEDDANTRFLVSDQLGEAGYDVTAVPDGEEAIRVLGQQTFDIVLLDIRMPVKDGLEVLRFMKQNSLRPRTIMVTAVEDASVALEAVKLGANDYITKPFSLQSLLTQMHRLLAR